MGLLRSNKSVDEAVERAQFAVREVTRSRVSNDFRQAEELRAQRLRDIGWDSQSDGDEAGVAR